MSNNIQNLFANRIGGKLFGKDKTIYKFEKIKIAKKEALLKNPGTKILDFGVGEPDEMAFSIVREELKKQVDDPSNRIYADNGIEEYKYVASKHMKEVFNVTLDPLTEINHTIGSKSALSMFPAIFINPGDIAFMTVPGYPVLGTHVKWYGGEVVNLELKKSNAFLPNLDKIPINQAKKAKILVLNYPNNPTGANASKNFYEECISFAKENNIVIVQDAAYAMLVYNSKPLSILSIDNAKDVAIEFHSLSKSYNMTGWRIGFVCGNPLLIKAFAHVKDNVDSGQFIAIQKAAIKALENPSITEKIKEKYSRRLNKLIKILKNKGFNVEKPQGTFYLFVEAPKKTSSGKLFDSGEDFSQFLISEKLISTVPWDDTGRFIRFSVTFEAKNETEENKIIEDLNKRLNDLNFEY